LQLVERITSAVPIPVNAMHLPGGPSRADWANAGIARVSHGPFPYMAMQEWLTAEAAAALL
jgi:2-methylisocitrate lyase-like PEP mutase family enzyme